MFTCSVTQWVFSYLSLKGHPTPSQTRWKKEIPSFKGVVRHSHPIPFLSNSVNCSSQSYSCPFCVCAQRTSGVRTHTVLALCKRSGSDQAIEIQAKQLVASGGLKGHTFKGHSSPLKTTWLKGWPRSMRHLDLFINKTQWQKYWSSSML